MQQNESLNIDEPRRPRYSKRRWAVVGDKHKAILLLLRRGVGICAIAEIVGVGVRTVQRRKALLNTELNEAIAEEEGEVVSFNTVGRQSMRCPVHGALTVWPCVACLAINAQSKANDAADDRTQRPRAS